MPNHKFHRNFNLLLILPACCLIASLLLEASLTEILILAGCFCYATLFANPDMDLANQIKLFTVTGVMSLPFKLFYAPFMKHRSKKLSHHLLWGTISRLIALLLFMLFCLFCYHAWKLMTSSGLSAKDLPGITQQICLLLTSAAQELYQQARLNTALICYGLSGFFLADISHISLDKLSR